MTEQKKRQPNSQSVVPAKNPKRAGRKKAVYLWCDPSKVLIPAHTPFGRMKKKIVEHLSGPFLEKPSPFAQTLIDGLAVNILMSKFFQAAFLRGNKIPASVLRDYTGLWNSISRDLATLQQMAKESGAKDPVPSLEEYLKSGKVTSVESETDPEGKPEQPKTLF